MARLTMILGLCGSGKSWLAERLGEQTGALLFDEPIGRNHETEIVQHLRAGRNCVVEEFFYCVESHRSKFVRLASAIPGVEIEFICYENDLEAANWNVRRRRNKGRVQEHLDLNNSVSPHYTYPDNSVRRPIFRIE